VALPAVRAKAKVKRAALRAVKVKVKVKVKVRARGVALLAVRAMVKARGVALPAVRAEVKGVVPVSATAENLLATAIHDARDCYDTRLGIAEKHAEVCVLPCH
jgi:hypothetical protein